VLFLASGYSLPHILGGLVQLEREQSHLMMLVGLGEQ
jgi:hypothetical protein